MLFLYLYQTCIVQYWTSKWWYVCNVIQTIEPHHIRTRVSRKKSWIYTIFRVLNFSITHGKRQFKYQTLISCNKNAVYRGITQTVLLEAFSDLADGLLLKDQFSSFMWSMYKLLYNVQRLPYKVIGGSIYFYVFN